MTIRIIDNKKIDLTNDEYALYEKICRSYDRPNFKGEYLFQDLFETDKTGKITFLKPPTTFSSMEVVLYLSNIMIHQHLRASVEETDKVLNEAKMLIQELKQMKESMKNK